MKMIKVILDEKEIATIVATMYGVDANDVVIKHKKETVGYGLGEHDVDRVEVEVNIGGKF